MLSDTLFFQSYKLVPEIKNPLIRSSMIAMTATALRMMGPIFIARGIDLGVLQSDFDTVLQQSLYYFITIVLLYFVQSKALLAIGLVGETYVKKVRQKLFRHLSSLDMEYFENSPRNIHENQSKYLLIN